MQTLWTDSELSQTPVQYKAINVGTDCTIELVNYSPYFITVATTPHDAQQTTSSNTLLFVEPYQGIRRPVPQGTAYQTLYAYPHKTAYSSNTMTLGSLSTTPDVSFETYKLSYPPTEWPLLGQGVSTMGGQSLPVDANITNSTIDIGTISGTVNANVTNSSLTVAGSVDANITNASIPISGSVNATIKNATIDTNSTVVNQQLGTGFSYSERMSLSVPSSTGAQTLYSAHQNIVPNGQSLASPYVELWLNSAQGEYSSYSNWYVRLGMTFADGTHFTIGTEVDIQNVTSSSGMYMINLAGLFNQNPVLFNTVAIGVQVGPNGITTADTVSFSMVFHGEANVQNTSDNFPNHSAPSFTLPGTATPTGMDNAVPLPIQGYRWNAAASAYDQVTQKHQFLSSSSIADTATNTIDVNITNVYRLDFDVAGTTGGLMRVVANPGGQWLCNIPTKTDNSLSSIHWDSLSSRGFGISGTTSISVEQLYGASSTTNYYTLSIIYD